MIREEEIFFYFCVAKCHNENLKKSAKLKQFLEMKIKRLPMESDDSSEPYDCRNLKWFHSQLSLILMQFENDEIFHLILTTFKHFSKPLTYRNVCDIIITIYELPHSHFIIKLRMIVFRQQYWIYTSKIHSHSMNWNLYNSRVVEADWQSMH